MRSGKAVDAIATIALRLIAEPDSNSIDWGDSEPTTASPDLVVLDNKSRVNFRAYSILCAFELIDSYPMVLAKNRKLRFSMIASARDSPFVLQM